MNKKIVAAVTAAAVLAGFSTSAMAAREAGDWIFRVGMTNVDPKQDNGNIDLDLGGALPVTVDDDTQLSLTGAYMFTQNFGVELLASLPFEHDVSIAGVQVGSTKHLPPTLNAQWHFNPQGNFHPYIGAGINYTTFFSEEWNLENLASTVSVASGGDPSFAEAFALLSSINGEVSLDDSFGYDIQAGVDFEIAENLMVNFDVRWIKIESDLKIAGEKVTTVKIDPLTVGLSLGWKF